MYGRHSRPVEHVRRVLCAVRVIYGGKARFLRLDPGDTPSAPSAQARALLACAVFRTDLQGDSRCARSWSLPCSAREKPALATARPAPACCGRGGPVTAGTGGRPRFARRPSWIHSPCRDGCFALHRWPFRVKVRVWIPKRKPRNCWNSSGLCSDPSQQTRKHGPDRRIIP